MYSHKILELFSGIGGMHYAWKESGMKGEVIAAVDINTVANYVYSHNFKNINIMNRNIQSLDASFINSLNPDVLLMSPPCQPYTRNGAQKDSQDTRAFSFAHLLSILQDLSTLNYILVENVKGFETSNSREALIKALKSCGFHYQEFLLTPQQIGIPNSRLRYYCLARRKPFIIDSEESIIMCDFPSKKVEEAYTIETIIDETLDDSYNLPVKFLKRAMVLDICYPDSKKSCCFTKAYTHFLEGTGSVFTKSTPGEVKASFEVCSNLCNESQEYNDILQKLNLRFFCPNEVSRLMAFPRSFDFPEDVSKKQRYRLLGNSINVKVVSELIKYLIDY